MDANVKLLAGKQGIVVGVANQRSIAWAIAKAWHEAGARLAFTYQGERLRENVEELVSEFGSDTPMYACDVTRDEDIARVFEQLKKDFGTLHMLLHSVAFAPKEYRTVSVPEAILNTVPSLPCAPPESVVP